MRIIDEKIDLLLEIYHRICFLLYKLPYVKRSTYIKIDRQKLSYLNWLEKLNCMYCSYANGLFHYASIIAAASIGRIQEILSKRTLRCLSDVFCRMSSSTALTAS